jgi:hypothetical protein
MCEKGSTHYVCPSDSHDCPFNSEDDDGRVCGKPICDNGWIEMPFGESFVACPFHTKVFEMWALDTVEKIRAKRRKLK